MKQIGERLDYLLSEGQKLIDSVTTWDNPHYQEYVKYRALAISFVLSLYSDKHPMYLAFVDTESHDLLWGNLIKIQSSLSAIKLEYENGWLQNFKGIVSSEIFGDFLEMAKYLQDEGYYIPAAVIIGSVLEEHIRQLCVGADIATTTENGEFKKASFLNTELFKAGVYTGTDHKAIILWQDIRNNAAHGHYDKVQPQQVDLMYQGVLAFMQRVPA